jgi:2,4-dienoyl-CoA reductase-like NADH-dependent reductase (Old Yellow Enzyme family)
MSALFSPWAIGPLSLCNRVVVPPMCQYSAVDGVPQDWHLMHYGALAASGAGLVIVEATGVSADGRISPGCLGLYDEAQQAGFAALLTTLRKAAPWARLAVQLCHAGRKASSEVPWRGGAQIPQARDDGWPAVAPSALVHIPGEEPPRALDADGVARVRNAFADAARRAAAAGFDGIELHMAHGYLLHEFLSPIANQRTDGWGGGLAQRMRFPLEVFDAVRAAVPAAVPVWVRLSVTDWVEGGWDVAGSIALGHELKARGCAAMHVSSGGVSPLQRIPLGPGYQVHLAQAIKAAVGLPTIAVGLITEAAQAEAIVAQGQADAVAVGRSMLYDPRWPWRAAATLGASVNAPRQYWRSQPQGVKDLFVGAKIGMR